MKAYTFRLYPSVSQEKILLNNFDLCRLTYNNLLERLNNSKKIDRGDIQHHIVDLKKSFPELKNVHSKVLQYECYRLFSNLSSLRELKKRGIKVGKLRFKGKFWFNTIHYNQCGFKLIMRNKRYDFLNLSKIGSVRMRSHRIVEGKIKHITIKKSIDKWYAIIITDEIIKRMCGNKELGIDMGIRNFYVDNENNMIKNPLYLEKSLSKVKRAHKIISRRKKGSKNRSKARIKLRKVHEKVSNQRNDFFHKLTTSLMNSCSMIAIEDLKIKNMMIGNYRNINRHISDSSWYGFTSMLKSKAESAGCSIIEVDPVFSTATCSNCGRLNDIDMKDKVYRCIHCGLEIDRDYNAARIILFRAQGLGVVEAKSLHNIHKDVNVSFADESRSHILNFHNGS